MATRRQNERKYGRWADLPDGGRRYWRDVRGRTSGSARYVKEVDLAEVTARLRQEIYDSDGNLVEIHCIYPVDTGHQKV